MVKRSKDEAGSGKFRRLEVVKNSFWYTKLTEPNGTGYKYDNVKTWTRKSMGVLDTDSILVPINKHGTHWWVC